MKTYIVEFYIDLESYSINSLEYFKCEADDLDHAKEQCQDAYKDCVINNIYINMEVK